MDWFEDETASYDDVRRRGIGFFFEAHQLAVLVELTDAELGRVLTRRLLDQQRRCRVGTGMAGGDRRKRLAEHVVAVHLDEGIGHEVAGSQQGVSKTLSVVLPDISERYLIVPITLILDDFVATVSDDDVNFRN